MSGTVEIEAPAKINLYLSVLGRRPDGFHEIETLFQSISLADHVVVGVEEEVAERPISLQVHGRDLGPVEDNLAYRAARRFWQETGRRGSIRVELTKRIPAGAGLGGGSSDAAAVLWCLATLAELGDVGSLRPMAAELGSDVAFFLAGSPLAMGSGRGDELTELAPLPEVGLVLAMPDVHVSTGRAYEELAARRRASRRGAPEHESEAAPSAGSEGAGMTGTGRPEDASRRAGIPPRSGLTWPDVARLAHNDFEPVVVPRHDAIHASLEGLRAEGASVALLSGSGAASFGLFETRAEAERAASVLGERHPWRFEVATTRTTVPSPRAIRGTGDRRG